MSHKIDELSPFGAVITNTGPADTVESFSPEQIFGWVKKYRVLVFRGYSLMPKQQFALFGQKLGKPLQWVFGAINELKVKPDAENYIFTDHAVPMHWDGAFAGKIPHVILFQCLVAPKKEDLGGTTFCDTRKLLENHPEKIPAWKKITVTYSTKKIVHYGGKITQPFIAAHEVEGDPVIRYAEPVADLNPVTLDIRGLEQQSPQEFISEIKTLLYHPDHLYTHRWEAGDIVMADNHSLLHGREAFKNANERHIQRVNILHRPPQTLGRFISNCLTIRRKEFFVAELPIFLIPLLLNIHGWQDLTQPTMYMGLLAIILLFNIGDMINCYEDYELDSIYKSHLSNAVYELGKKNVKLQILLSGFIALVLTIIVAILSQQLYLVPLTIVGLFIGLQYSMRPFKFKSKGLWQLLCLWGIIFFGPMVYTAIVVKTFPDLWQILLFSFYGFHQMGIIMLNTAEDYTEDKMSGLTTIIVRLGLHKAMNFAYGLVIASGLLAQATFAMIFFNAETPSYVYAGISIFTFGWIKIVREYRILIRKINTLNEEEALKELQKNGMKVPEWLKMGAYTFLAVVCIYFIQQLYFH